MESHNWGKSRPSVVEYVSDEGEPNGVSYQGVVSDVELDGDASSMTWTCEPDDDLDPIEIVIDVQSYAELLVKARTHCETCADTECNRSST